MANQMKNMRKMKRAARKADRAVRKAGRASAPKMSQAQLAPTIRRTDMGGMQGAMPSPTIRRTDAPTIRLGQRGYGSAAMSGMAPSGGKGGARPAGPAQLASTIQRADMGGMQRMRGGGYLKKKIDGRASRGKTKGRVF